MRASSFEAYQELKYFCLECRAENCVDLPQWHWGKVRDLSGRDPYTLPTQAPCVTCFPACVLPCGDSCQILQMQACTLGMHPGTSHRGTRSSSRLVPMPPSIVWGIFWTGQCTGQ